MHILWNLTGAGRRRVLPKGKDWICPECERQLKYYWRTCPNDGTKRPDARQES